MSSTEQHIAGWLRDGVIDAATAANIRAFEAARAGPEPAAERLSVLEAMVYLGLAVVAVGVAVLVGLAWPDMAWPVRSAVFAVPGVLAFAAGGFFRRTGTPPFQRAGSVAWLACVPLAAATVATAADGLNAAGEDAALAGCLVATAVAALLWLKERRAPQVVGTMAALAGVAMSLAARPAIESATLAGLGLTAVGVLSIALAEFRLAGPFAALRFCGALATAFGAVIVNSQFGISEVFGPAVAIALIALAVRRNSLAYIAAGVATLFISVVMTVARHVEDPAGVAIALIFCGVALVGAVIVLLKFRPWMGTPGGALPRA